KAGQAAFRRSRFCDIFAPSWAPFAGRRFLLGAHDMDERQRYLATWVDKIKSGKSLIEVGEWFLWELAKMDDFNYEQLAPLNKVFADAITFQLEEAGVLDEYTAHLPKRAKH